jgi:inner membrane protein
MPDTPTQTAPPPLPKSQPSFGKRNSTIIKPLVAGVYTFLYITLRQQDYALLMGAIALFIVLAVVMYVTRKVAWYARDAN